MKTLSSLLLALVILFSNQSFGQWQHVLSTDQLNIHAFAISGSNLFAGGDSCGVFISSDDGVTWRTVNNGLLDTSVYALTASHDTIYAGTPHGVFRSTNNGASWNLASSGLPMVGFYLPNVIIANGQRLYTATQQAGVYFSTNAGATWKSLNYGLTYPNISALILVNTDLFAGTTGGGLFKLSLNDTTWTAANNGLTNNWIQQLLPMGSYMLAGTGDSAIFISSDNGSSWDQSNKGIAPARYRYVSSLASHDSTIFAIVEGVLYFSKDSGANWHNSFPTLPSEGNHLMISDSSVFTTIYGNGIWKCPLKQVTTSVSNSTHNPSPLKYALSQNYPNPFNPSTTISFDIGSASFVNLEIYDLLGRRVESLVNMELPAGSYTKVWNANQFAGGIYFCKLTVYGAAGYGIYNEIRKLVLLK